LHEDKKTIMGVLGGILGFMTFFTVLLTPILAYANFKITHIENSYWSLRYTVMLFYIVFNILINVFPLVNNFLFFLSDGLLLT
jgi:hypothetical protein